MKKYYAIVEFDAHENTRISVESVQFSFDVHFFKMKYKPKVVEVRVGEHNKEAADDSTL